MALLGGALGTLVALSFPAGGHAATIAVNCSAGGTLQGGIDALADGDVLLVTGACVGATVPATKVKVVIDGQKLATVNGIINVLGREVTIKRFTVNGAVFLLRGATAVVHNNTIEAVADGGIGVLNNSFARITKNTVENQPGAGCAILVNEGSGARIGFIGPGDPAPTPNTIQNNQGSGICVLRGANASIVGNTISGNGGDGIFVGRGSYAEIAGNTLNTNGGNGINAVGASGLDLGRDTGTGITDVPNSTTVNNLAAGIACGRGGSVNGRQGTLNGNGGPTGFDGTCINSLSP
jgi:parallel beta-helix repeat protein